MTVDLKHLRQIVAIAETGHFAKAATLLSISQPALSRSLQSLERRLGTRLFDRGQGGVVPTPTGRALLNHARALLKQAAEAEREIGLLVGRAAGHLRIGAGPYPAALSIGSAVAELVGRYPGLSVEVQVGDWDVLTPMVLDGQIDVAVAEIDPSEQDRRLFVERLPSHPGGYFCRAGHPLSRGRGLTFQDIRQFPLAMTVLPERLRHIADREAPRPSRGGAKSALPWIHVNTFELARQIVLESDAIGVAVPDQIASEISQGLLKMLGVPLPGAYTNYGIITLAGRTLSPSAESFTAILRGVEAKITSMRRKSRERTRPRAAAPRIA
jgi:DNA-binding transcriptional LysR family regulator